MMHKQKYLRVFIFGLIITTLWIHDAAAETLRAERPSSQSLLVMDLRANGVDSSSVQTIQGLLVDEISKASSASVLGGEDLRRVLEVQNNKALMGCNDDACMAEIAGALGAEQVIYGSLGKLGQLYILQLVLFDAGNVQVIRRANIRESKLEKFPELLPALVGKLLNQQAKAQDPQKQNPLPKNQQGPHVKNTQAADASMQINWPAYAMYGAATLSLLSSLGLAVTTYTWAYLPLTHSLNDIRTAETDGDIGEAVNKQSIANDLRERTWTLAGLSTATAVLGAGLLVGAIFVGDDDELAENKAQEVAP